MGCNSDYMNPTGKEQMLHKTATLYAYALCAKHGKEHPLSADLIEAISTPYTRHDFTADLCALIQSLDIESFDAIVYNARNKDSRELAQWWEDHQAADKARLTREIQEKFKANPILSQFIGLQSQFLNKPCGALSTPGHSVEYFLHNHPSFIERKAKAMAHEPFFQLKEALEIFGDTRPPKEALTFSYRNRREFSSHFGTLTLQKPICSTQGLAAIESLLPQSTNPNKNIKASPQAHFIRTFWQQILDCCQASGLQATLHYQHDGCGMESWYAIELHVPIA